MILWGIINTIYPITDYTDIKLKPNPEARQVQAVHSPRIMYDVTDSLLVSLLQMSSDSRRR
jgi:hypothetical protein